jgi:hypothetical protein
MQPEIIDASRLVGRILTCRRGRARLPRLVAAVPAVCLTLAVAACSSASPAWEAASTASERSAATASAASHEEARLLLQAKAPGATVPAETISGIRTYAHTNARPARGSFPLGMLSLGLTLPRVTLTSLAEDLASRGDVVALVDHTYESSGTTF